MSNKASSAEEIILNEIFIFERYIKVKCDSKSLIELGRTPKIRKDLARYIEKSLDSFDLIYRSKATLLPVDYETLKNAFRSFDNDWRNLILKCEAERRVIVEAADFNLQSSYFQFCRTLFWRLTKARNLSSNLKEKLLTAGIALFFGVLVIIEHGSEVIEKSWELIEAAAKHFGM